jgi:2-phosphosulfolactate phosphatase
VTFVRVDSHGQSQYQVRFDWGAEGAATIGVGADVVVLVDVLEGGGLSLSKPRDNGGLSLSKPLILDALADTPAVIVAGSLRNRMAVAKWALERQGTKGERFMVAVVAAGEVRSDGSIRFAIEDLLGAGAIIDALADVGIDYCSPEAAAAAAAFTGLRNATGHLIGASASGRERAANGQRVDVDNAIEMDVSTSVDVLREFTPDA